VPNAVAVARSVQEGLVGFEWAIGIPGTIGGSVRGNAGCFGGEMKDVVESVTIFNTETEEVERMENPACAFGYRDSMFKRSPHLIVVDALLRLREGDKELSQKLVRHYTSLRTASQDIGEASAGCIFKNVAWPKDAALRGRLLRLVPELAEFDGQAVIPVGFLIDRLGLKGKTIGQVGISKKHGNYLVNRGGATAEEVIMMIGFLKERIHRKYDLHPEEEIQYIGFDAY